ncbi:glycosyl hydrolase [Micromonospora sp. BRA006-A]|nr:glycosyl hydrolase [Micromonospora sp. BRA006-A]
MGRQGSAGGPDRRDRRPTRADLGPRRGADRDAEPADQLAHRRLRRDRPVVLLRPQLGHADRLPGLVRLDEDLNDHHFHYGYFIAAAATLAKPDPAGPTTAATAAWSTCSSATPTTTTAPTAASLPAGLRHLRRARLASGLAPFFAGNNQESSSEGMNFANALIQWGQATGDTAVRDAGVYLWTTQSAAISEYWFDVYDQNFPAAFGAQDGRHGGATAGRTRPGSPRRRR